MTATFEMVSESPLCTFEKRSVSSGWDENDEFYVDFVIRVRGIGRTPWAGDFLKELSDE